MNGNIYLRWNTVVNVKEKKRGGGWEKERLNVFATKMNRTKNIYR